MINMVLRLKKKNININYLIDRNEKGEQKKMRIGEYETNLFFHMKYE